MLNIRRLCLAFIPVVSLCGSLLVLSGSAQDTTQRGPKLLKPFVTLGRGVSDLGNSTVTHGSELFGNWSKPEPLTHPEYYIQVDPGTRAAYIARAQLWQPRNISALTPAGIRAGEKSALRNDQEITCNYVQRTKEQLGGRAPKFECVSKDGQTYRVKYGKPKAYTTVAASRLFWALGYGADIVTPVKVTCQGCSPDPWKNPAQSKGQVRFDEATVEKLQPGKEITLKGKSEVGWSWKKDLPLVSAEKGGATRGQVDGLALLAAIVQHGDSKSEQQKLICRPNDYDAKTDTCRRPYMYVHDLGRTFGADGIFVKPLDFEKWAHKAVWKDSEHCVANIRENIGNGDDGLNYPRISEEGRAFLAGLLSQLIARRDNVVAIFDAAHFGNLDDRHPAGAWADLFIRKAEEVINHPACHS
jgi:hypothetical protein